MSNTDRQTNPFRKTVRSHPWHDHSFRRVAKMTERAAPGYVELRSLEAGKYTEELAHPKWSGPLQADRQLCFYLEPLLAPWGDAPSELCAACCHPVPTNSSFGCGADDCPHGIAFDEDFADFEVRP